MQTIHYFYYFMVKSPHYSIKCAILLENKGLQGVKIQESGHSFQADSGA